MSLPNHGANPNHLAEALGIKLPEHVNDFSVNTNPFGPPNVFLNIDLLESLSTISTYPDPHVTELRERLAQQNAVLSTQILVGNGAAELIFLLAGLFRGKKVRIVEPAFSEYRDACLAHDCQVQSLVLEAPWKLDKEHIKAAIKDIDLLFLCSPNNPTGIRYEDETIIALVEAAERAGIYVVIDEAFYDFCEQKRGLQELIHSYSKLILLRSMTKMYAIAGIRLGYMLANEELIQQIKKRQPPWSVNGLAQKIGLQLLDEDDFVKKSVADLSSERERMRNELVKLDFDISPSVVNFYLVSEQKKENLKPLMLFLAEHGIVARHTYNFNGLNGKYLRLAVKDKQANDRLLHVMAKWRQR